MAKKQVFGDEALALKLSQRKMAKVIIPHTNGKGGFAFSEAIMDQEKVKEYIAAKTKS
jgi:hypothetical protein